MSEDELEIIDGENYMGQKNITFSHQDLVMRALKRVGEISGHELTDGVSIGVAKHKDEKITIKEDTRKAFINAVRTSKCVMNRDFDGTARDRISKCYEDMEETKKELLKLQWKWWINSSPKQRTDKGITLEPNFFNKSLSFYMEYLDFQIEMSWNIFEELNNLTGRLGDYQLEDLEG